ncbi:uncharacterized protein DFL_001692 [Arthrobotrys flagrans]|uniref:Uncharacterized protein n=1 Tax=Arthrobotrys flagrans TaxID=97331 RepID=A0A437A954_ARTFL|nr:hypothetical protein DFL_001692 [Arthrobotrys flagrans]
MEPTRRSKRNENRKEKRAEQAKAAAAAAAAVVAETTKATAASGSKAKAKPAATNSTTAKGAQPRAGTGRGRGAKKAEAEEKLARAPAKKSKTAAPKSAPAKKAVSANKQNIKKPRKGRTQVLPGQEEEEGEEDGEQPAEESEEESGEEVVPAPAKKRAQNPAPTPAPAQRGRKRKSGSVSQPPVAKKRKIAVPRKGKGKQKPDPSPELETEDPNEEEEGPEEEPEESDEEEGPEGEPTEQPNNKGKRTTTENPRATSPEAEEEVHYLPDFETPEDLDRTPVGITYNSSPSEEVPNVTIPPGFRVKVATFEITRIEAKDNSALFECNCKQYKSCTYLRTCKHLLLFNGPRFEKKRLSDIRAKLGGMPSGGGAQEGTEAAPAESTEATENPTVAEGEPPSESSPAVVGSSSTRMDVEREEGGVSGQ